MWQPTGAVDQEDDGGKNMIKILIDAIHKSVKDDDTVGKDKKISPSLNCIPLYDRAV